MKDKFSVCAISSPNGTLATARAVEAIHEGADTLEAVVQGVTLVEDDPDELTVGYGGLPNEDGFVELDAAVMDGPRHSAGAVAALRNIRNPARVAQRVLQQSDHVLIVGEGALRFARAQGFVEENLLTEKARKIWLYWKQTLSPKDDWLPPPEEGLDPDVAKFFGIRRGKGSGGRDKSSGTSKPSGGKKTSGGSSFERPTGTVHCSAMNAAGDISCATSTSGLAFKIPGRVGDSPILGAGLYVDNEVGSCGATGRGEAAMQSVCSFAAVNLMREGKSPAEAGLEVLRDVVHRTPKRLQDKTGRPTFNLQLFLLRKDGQHAGVTIWGPGKYAVTDAKGTRLEKGAHLYTRE